MDLGFGSAGEQSGFALARNAQVFSAQAIVTATGIWSTAAGMGGPLLWNPTTSNVNAIILGATLAVTTASAAAVAIGLTGATGQTAAPTSTTAIDSVGCTFINGKLPLCNTYRIGTPTNAGTFFSPLWNLDTTALTANPSCPQFIPLYGLFVVPPGSWIALAASAIATTAVCQCSLIWAEYPHL